MAQNDYEAVDVLLVGAGIMSATLAVLLKELDPSIKLEVVEMQGAGAIESSNPWNNAGTGHAGLCELNYTPEAADGSVGIAKAVQINTQFEVSKQFWAHLMQQGNFGSPKAFINPIPHLSFVQGEKGIKFLKTRHAAMVKHHAFDDMVYTEDKATMAEWMPLMMPGRAADEAIAATRVESGTDVNFGALTNQLLKFLGEQPGCNIRYNQKVTGLKRTDS
ncbi:MAG: malate:quinone oxidoreductase, partial [Pseudomonas sp.]